MSSTEERKRLADQLTTSFAAGYRCPDCNSDTELSELVPGVFRLAVLHDETCPTLRRLAGKGET